MSVAMPAKSLKFTALNIISCCIIAFHLVFVLIISINGYFSIVESELVNPHF